MTWSFAEVDDLADRAATGLLALGVAPGDTVAIFMGNDPHLVPLAFGVNRLGAIWVPTNTDYKGEWLFEALLHSRAEVLVVDADLLARLEPIASNLRFRHVVVCGASAATGALAGQLTLDDLLAQEPSAEVTRLEASVVAGHTAAVLWTSGTTGRPKGVMQSHHAWLRAALSGAASSCTQPTDRLYCCLPLYNSAAWVGVVYRSLVAGVPFALDQHFSVSGFWDRTRHFGCSQAFTLGAMHLFLWHAPPRADDADNPVRCLGAIPMPDAIVEPFKRRFGIEIIQQGYGQSEVMGLVSRFDDGETKWNDGAVGKPLEGIEVRLLDDEDREVAIGEVGEFCVRPTEPNAIFNGYFNDPEATLRACRNLWYHTGDLGRLDEDGQFHFVDRKADLIRFKGRSVSSLAVEAAVRAHPAVAEAAAFGVPSEVLDTESEIMVAVVAAPGARVEEAELARFVNDRVPYFVVPRFIEVVEELPHTPTGKVQKHLLRARGISPATWDREACGFKLER